MRCDFSGVITRNRASLPTRVSLLGNEQTKKKMNQQLRYVVDTLNLPPYNKRLNLVTFDSLNTFSLLQVLNDVLAEISPDHKIDLREESPDQTAIRMLNLLRILQYKPKGDQGEGVTAFRQGLIQGDKATIYPLLHWLLEKTAELKKRAYLAPFLIKIDVPSEYLQDETVIEVCTIHDELVEQFKELHKTVEQQRSSKFSVAEVRRDIKSMEDEKEQLTKRVEKLRNKSSSVPKQAPLLDACRKLRKERDKQEELAEQRTTQKNQLLHAQQKIQQLETQLSELVDSSEGLNPEKLISQLEEENHLKHILTQETLPKKLEAKKKECSELEQVLSEPLLSQASLDALQQQIDEANAEISRLMEKRMPGTDPLLDKLAIFRQQASIIAHKKETAADEYKVALDELSAAQGDLSIRQKQLSETEGGEVLREEEFKKFVAKLRFSNNTYKEKKNALSALKAEYGVLARTEEILKSRDENLQDLLVTLEQKKGVHGYRETQENLEHVSTAKSGLDEQKENVLKEMSATIERLNAAIAEKKASLAPMVKELRPLRQKHQELLATHTEKKLAYDTMMAGLESKRSALEQEVRVYWEEIINEHSKYHSLQNMLKLMDIHTHRLAVEMKCYTSSDPAEKRKSLRDQLTRKIQEQENHGKELKAMQREIKETHADSMKQVKMWKDLRRLFELKKECFLQAEQQKIQSAAITQSSATGEDRLVLS